MSECPHCGPICYGGAAHNARAEDGAIYAPERKFMDSDNAVPLILENAEMRERIAKLEAQLRVMQQPVSVDELPVGKQVGQVEFNRIIGARTQKVGA